MCRAVLIGEFSDSVIFANRHEYTVLVWYPQDCAEPEVVDVRYLVGAYDSVKVQVKFAGDRPERVSLLHCILGEQ